MQLRVFVRPIHVKDNLRTIEAQFPKKLRTTEAHFEFTGPYKKKSEKNNGPRRNDEGQGLNDEGQGLYVPFIHILS